MVPMGRLELPRVFTHYPLKIACLPIPPHRQYAIIQLVIAAGIILQVLQAHPVLHRDLLNPPQALLLVIQ